MSNCPKDYICICIAFMFRKNLFKFSRTEVNRNAMLMWLIISVTTINTILKILDILSLKSIFSLMNLDLE